MNDSYENKQHKLTCRTGELRSRESTNTDVWGGVSGFPYYEIIGRV